MITVKNIIKQIGNNCHHITLTSQRHNTYDCLLVDKKLLDQMKQFNCLKYGTHQVNNSIIYYFMRRKDNKKVLIDGIEYLSIKL